MNIEALQEARDHDPRQHDSRRPGSRPTDINQSEDAMSVHLETRRTKLGTVFAACGRRVKSEGATTDIEQVDCRPCRSSHQGRHAFFESGRVEVNARDLRRVVKAIQKFRIQAEKTGKHKPANHQGFTKEYEESGSVMWSLQALLRKDGVGGEIARWEQRTERL